MQDEQGAGDVLHTVGEDGTEPRPQGEGGGPWAYPGFVGLHHGAQQIELDWLFTRELVFTPSSIQSSLEIDPFILSDPCVFSRNWKLLFLPLDLFFKS